MLFQHKPRYKLYKIHTNDRLTEFSAHKLTVDASIILYQWGKRHKHIYWKTHFVFIHTESNTSAMKAIANGMGKLDEVARDGATWQQCY